MHSATEGAAVPEGTRSDPGSPEDGVGAGVGADAVLGGALAALAVGLVETVLRLARGHDPGLDLGLLAWSGPAHALAGGACGAALFAGTRLLSRRPGRRAAGSPLRARGGGGRLSAWILGQVLFWLVLVVATRTVRQDGSADFPDGKDLLQLSGFLLAAGLAARLLVPRLLAVALVRRCLPARRRGVVLLLVALLVATLVAPGVLDAAFFGTAERPGYAALLFGEVGPPASSAQGPPGPPTRDRPDVILVTLDTTRADHLSAFGYERETSPRLAALAAEGLRFDRAVAASSWTLPTHASMFTGLLPREHGARFARRRGESDEEPSAPEAAPLDPAHATLAEVLRAEGYRTGAFVAGPYLLAKYGVAQGFEWYDDRISVSAGHELALFAWLEVLFGDAVVDVADFALGYRRADEVNTAAEAWLDGVGGDRVFLFVNYFDAHGPLRPVRSVRSLFPGSELPVRRVDVDRTYTQVMSGRGELADDVRRWMVSQYDAELAFQDAQMGRLLDRLERDGRLEQALVIVLADHGENLGEGGLIGHGFTLREPVTHVPLVVKPPRGDGIAPGVRTDLVHQTDVFPTVLERLGLEPLRFAPTSPARSLFSGPVAGRAAFSELHPDPYRFETFGERWRRRVYALALEDRRLLEATPITASGEARPEASTSALYGSLGEGPEGAELSEPERAAELLQSLRALLERTPEHVPSEWLRELEQSGGGGDAALGAVGYAGD